LEKKEKYFDFVLTKYYILRGKLEMEIYWENVEEIDNLVFEIFI
jgi:hypothetical protein